MQADSGLVYSSPNWRETLKSFKPIKDNKTKLALEPYPDVKVLIAFADLAYYDSPEDILEERKIKNTQLKGWHLLTTAKKGSWLGNLFNGYFGCALLNKSLQQVVIAHRGTACLGAYGIDFKGVYRNKYTKHMGSAVTFADDVKEAILEINQRYDSRFVMSFTGHSLGAWLAAVTTMTVKYLKRAGDGFCRIASPNEGLHPHTVALDSPGVENMLMKISRDYSVRYNRSMCTKQLDITTYFAAPNLVNCAGYHEGDLRQIHIERVVLPRDSGMPWFNLDTHGRSTFIKAFDDGKDIHEVQNWPQGWRERENYHKKEVFSNSYILNLDIPSESSRGSSPNTQLVEGNAGNEHSKETSVMHYSTKPWSGDTCHLGVFSTEEFNFIQNWSLFQSNPQIERTKINNFTKIQNLERLNLPTFEFNTRKNIITCKSREHCLKEVIRITKQLLRWFPGIMNALAEQNESIESAPLYMASQAYLRTLPYILDCEDTLGLETFLESSEQHVLQIIVTSDFEFEAARLYNILTLMENTSLRKIYLEENCHILNWNDMPKLAKTIRFESLKNSKVSNLLILNSPPLTDTNNQLIPSNYDLGTILSILGSKTKLVTIRSQSVKEIIESYNLTVQTNILKAFELSDLTLASRGEIFVRDAITLGEETLSLAILLGNDCKSPNDKINRLISPILKSLVMDNLCIDKIPNNLPRLCELDALYSKGYKRMDKVGLTALLERSGADGPILVISDPEQLGQDYWGEVAEAARRRIFTTVTDGMDLFQEKCRTTSARLVYWFNLSAEGFTLKEVYNSSVYLPRKFHCRYIVKIDEFVWNSRPGDLFIFQNVRDKISLIHPFCLSREAEEAFVTNNNINMIFPSQTLNSEDKIKEISLNKHYFKLLEIRGSPCLVWQYSDGSLDGLRPFITRDYRDPIGERDFCIRKKKVVIIADEPGMGKTTSLTRISELIQDSWVLRVDHKHLHSATANLPPKLDLDSVTKYLLHVTGLPTDKKMMSSLLRYCLQSVNARQVYVLVDAFDEITGEKTKCKMVELLKFLKTATTCQTIVTTRIYQKKRLEDDLEEYSVELEKITEEEQENYLVNSWLPHLSLVLPEHGVLEKWRLRLFARELQKEVDGVLGGDVASFMGIPLQIRMLAEVFLQQTILSVVSPEQAKNLCKITNLFDLYKQFIEIKNTIYFEQKNKINTLPPMFQNALIKEMMEKHCVLAFQTVDPTFAAQYFKNINLTEQDFKDICTLGLIRFKTDGTFPFIHRTFQEYFCADFFVRWLKQRNDSNEINILITNEMCKFLLQPDYKIIRMFIETQLEISPIPDDTLKNHPIIYQHWYEHRQSFFHNRDKTPLHIAAEEQNVCTIAVLLSGPSSRTSEEAYISFIAARDQSRRTALNILLEKRNTNIVKLIMENIKSFLYESILKLMLATFFTGDDKIDDPVFYHGDGNEVNITFYKSHRNNRYRSYRNSNDSDRMEEICLLNLFPHSPQLITVNQALRRTHQIRKNIFNPFIAAVRENDYEVVVKILSDMECDTERTYLLIAIDGRGNTAINLAIRERSHMFFKLFAKQGVCVSYDGDGQTPLHYAAKDGYINIVNYLLNPSELTYEHIKTSNNCPRHEEVLNQYNITLKYKHASSTNTDDFRANIDSANRAGYTALMLASENGHHEVVGMLLKSGADIKSANANSETALILAAKNEHLEVVRMLLESGADVKSANRYDKTALMLAAEGGHQEVVRMLLEFGADVYPAKSDGYTALRLAAFNGHHEVVCMLLESGADVNSSNNIGLTALIFAAQNGHREVVRMLLNFGANINHQSILSDTALYRAAYNGHVNVVKLLLQYNPNISLQDKDGNTALHRAELLGHQDIVNLLCRYQEATPHECL